MIMAAVMLSGVVALAEEAPKPEKELEAIENEIVARQAQVAKSDHVKALRAKLDKCDKDLCMASADAPGMDRIEKELAATLNTITQLRQSVPGREAIDKIEELQQKQKDLRKQLDVVESSAAGARIAAKKKLRYDAMLAWDEARTGQDDPELKCLLKKKEDCIRKLQKSMKVQQKP